MSVNLDLRRIRKNSRLNNLFLSTKEKRETLGRLIFTIETQLTMFSDRRWKLLISTFQQRVKFADVFWGNSNK